MKKLIASVIMLTIIIFPLSAQKNKDVLYLKNGSSISGKLMEVSDSVFKIKVPDGAIFTFSSTEVKKMVNELPQFEGRKKSGFGFAVEAGLLTGAQISDYKAPFSFNILLNITSNTQSIFGLGSGVEYLGQTFTPVLLEYKCLFSDKKTTPFLFVRGGKLFHLRGESQSSDVFTPPSAIERSYKGGGSFTCGMGISWAGEDMETYLSFAYRNLHTSYAEKTTNSTVTYKNSYHRLEIKFGFRF
jgi:hypothetical protein